ncbi:hypothetical protein Y032_0501g2610 [Ancylostoma ceylanicum]|nr:hypothetical protein Y032_0501g2610 [Ancylostoma ceylanicum]
MSKKLIGTTNFGSVTRISGSFQVVDFCADVVNGQSKLPLKPLHEVWCNSTGDIHAPNLYNMQEKFPHFSQLRSSFEIRELRVSNPFLYQQTWNGLLFKMNTQSTSKVLTRSRNMITKTADIYNPST